MPEITECSKCKKLETCAMKRADSDVLGCNNPEQSKPALPKVWHGEEKEGSDECED